MDRHAISHSGSFGCAALQQNVNCLTQYFKKAYSYSNRFTKVKKLIYMFRKLSAFSCSRVHCRRRTRVETIAVGFPAGSAAMRTTDGNENCRIAIFNSVRLVFSGVIFTHNEFVSSFTIQSIRLIKLLNLLDVVGILLLSILQQVKALSVLMVPTVHHHE